MAIVVGVDGSDNARDALRWGLEEARMRHTSVEVVYAWAFPYGYTGFGWAPALDQEALDEVRRSAEEALEEWIAAIAVADAYGEVEVTQSAVEGPPGPVLLEKSEGAELLVVGSRGLGGFKELLLGSVSHQCAQHASCPVVIIRHPNRD
jgi:nucleotide-binding universal stress UspA family protein